MALASEQHCSEDIDFDENMAAISEGDDNGAYVQAWLWVDFSCTELDKSVKDEAPLFKTLRSHWDKDPVYPVEDWATEVANDETRQSYFEWVESQREES